MEWSLTGLFNRRITVNEKIMLGADSGETPGKHFLPTVNSSMHADNQPAFPCDDIELEGLK